MARTTVLTKQNRNPTTITSISIAPLPTQRFFAFSALMDVADLTDTALTVRYRVQASYEPTATNWSDLFGGIWRGGLDSEGNPRGAPNQEWSGEPVPLFIRIELEWSKRISIGADLETR